MTHARDADVRILDLRRTGFESGHVPNAVWLDPESIRDVANGPSYMLNRTSFEQAMGQLGISDQTRVIAYDDRGGLLASRLWWILNAYGHSNVALMNGGWVQWTAEKRATTTAVPQLPAATFTATLQPQWLATADDVKAAIGKPGTRILDARTVAEMDGSDTRLSDRGGVIPSAVPVYWEDLLDPVRKTFKTADELRAIYAAHGIQTVRRGDRLLLGGPQVGGGPVCLAPDWLRTPAKLSRVVGGVEPPHGSAGGAL